MSAREGVPRGGAPRRAEGFFLLLAALGLCAVTLSGLGRPLGNGDEVIYAQNLREMAASGDFFTLTWYGTEVHQRPPTPFWGTFLVSRIVGGELGLRLFSALCSLATLAIVFALAYRRQRRYDVGLIAALLCAGVPSFHLFSRALLSDPALAFALTAGVAGTVWAHRDPRGLVVAAAGLGAGFACKSLAAAIPALALAPWIVCAARKHRRLEVVLLAAAVFLALAVPFYLVGLLRDGDEFLRWHFGRSLLERAQGEVTVAAGTGPLYYLRHLTGTDGIAMALALVGGPLVAVAVAIRERDWLLGVTGSYALVLLAGLSLVGTRLPHYLLPLYPAAAVAAAGAYGWASSRLRPLYRGLAVAGAATLFLTGIASPPEEHFLPSPSAHVLGEAARESGAPGERIYTLNWYAPALGYYARKEWHLLSSHPEMTERMRAYDMLRRAGVVHQVPPWPEGEFLVAGAKVDVARAPLEVIEVVAESGSDLLVVARF